MLARYLRGRSQAIVLLATFLLAPTSAHSQGTVDVSFNGDGLSSSFATAVLPSKIPIGQTFIPNAHSLIGLDLELQTGQSTGLRVVTVEIREGGIEGTVVGLATDTIDVPGTGPFVHHFHVDASVLLVPGSTYAIQVPYVDISLVGGSSTDSNDPLLYPDGAFFQGGLEGPEPGGATFILTSDLFFTTYTADLFLDGFESGDTSAWSSAVP